MPHSQCNFSDHASRRTTVPLRLSAQVGNRHRLAVVAVVSMIILIAIAIGCRRDNRSPEPIPEADTVPGALTFANGLHALTNLTLFAETPRGRSARITYDGNHSTRVVSNGWTEVATLPGPGRIERIWSNAETNLQWRFYFDHEAVARLDLGTRDLFGGKKPFIPPLADSVNGGRVAYVPLPYQQSIRIAIGSKDATTLSNAAIQVDYRSYAPDQVTVESFCGELNADERDLLESVRNVWQDPCSHLRIAGETCGPPKTYLLQPGETVVWLDENGPGILRTFRLHTAFPDELSVLQRARILRALVIRFRWDNAEYPSVNVPLGDFFVNAMRPRRFASLPLGYIDGHYVCRFPMPFQQAARAELRNDGNAPVILYAAAHIETGAIPPRQDNYFHAGWQTATDDAGTFHVLQRNDSANQESGHLVGTMMHITGLSADAWPIFNAVDEISLHGPPETRLRGTGLAAAFNTDGRFPGLFDHPLAGLVETAAIRMQGYRWLLTDRIPFTHGIDYRWKFEHTPPIRRSLATTAYWYQPEPQPVPELPPLPERRITDDRMDQATIMTALFELERIGHDDEARDRAIEYYERYPHLIMADYLRIRALAYEQRLSGYAMVEELYETILQRIRGTAVARELERMQWFHRGTDHGLFATQINGRFRAYLNGRRIEQGDNPSLLTVRPVRLQPGTNRITVKVIPNKPDAWMSLYLQTHHTNIVSGLDWEFSRQKPSDWPLADCRETTWSPVAEAVRLPLPRWWRLNPNIFPYMQSADQLVIPWRGPGWTEPPFEETYFRKQFVMPDPMERTDDPKPKPVTMPETQ